MHSGGTGKWLQNWGCWKLLLIAHHRLTSSFPSQGICWEVTSSAVWASEAHLHMKVGSLGWPRGRWCLGSFGLPRAKEAEIPLSALLFPLRLRDPYSLTKQKCSSSVVENGFHSLTPFSVPSQPLGTSVSPLRSPMTEVLLPWILIILHLEQKAHSDTKSCSRET